MLEVKPAKSVYKPIQIKLLDGKVYTAVPMTRPVLVKMQEQEKRIRRGDAVAAYEQLEMLFNKKGAFDNLELREINQIIAYVTKACYNPEEIEDKEETPDEKKESGPGVKK